MQISLFVIPVLVLLGWIIDKPLSLLYVVASSFRQQAESVTDPVRCAFYSFDPLETVVLFLSVLLVRFATEDGRTHCKLQAGH